MTRRLNRPLDRHVLRDDFICAICERSQVMKWNYYGPDTILPPLCRICEREYSVGSGSAITDGAFGDRRIVIQGFALAEALHSKAGLINWESRHGRA